MLFIFQEAAKTIALLRGLDVDDKIVQNEMDNIKREDETFKSIPNFNFFGICEYFTLSKLSKREPRDTARFHMVTVEINFL